MPRPSRAPEEVTDTEEITNPAQMIRRAVPPAWMVSGWEVNSPIRGSAQSRQTTVPKAMMIPLAHRVALYSCRTRPRSPAP